MKKFICSTCGSVSKGFKPERDCLNHIHHKHPKKDGEPVLYLEGSGESMADLFLEGELNRAMGEANPEWLEDMLP